MCRRGPNPTVEPDKILSWVDDHDDPVVMAKEVADHFGYSRGAAHNRLNRLVEDGKLRKKKSGRRTAVWFTPVD